MLDLSGFIVRSERSVFNPITGVEYRESRLPRIVSKINVDNTGTFKTTEFITKWSKCEWYYKEVDYHPYSGSGRSNWEDVNYEDFIQIEEFIINSL